jgi:hypothetical protein
MTPLEWFATWPDFITVRYWVAAQSDQSPASLVATCPRGEWLLRLAISLGYPADVLLAAVRPVWLRAVRDYAPRCLDDGAAEEDRTPEEAAGLRARADALRQTADDAAAAAAEAAFEASDSAERGWRDFPYGPADGPSWAGHAAESFVVGNVWGVVNYANHSAQATGYRCDSDESAAWAAENARCADDIRTALPDLAERWAAAL